MRELIAAITSPRTVYNLHVIFAVALIAYGLYLKHGGPLALIVTGTIMLLLSIYAAERLR